MSGPLRFSLSRLATARPKTVLLIWLVACAVVYVQLRDGVAASGDLWGLTRVEHRPRTDEPLLLLTLDPTVVARETATTDTLLAAAASVRERLGPERVSLAPPAAEVAGWLDAFALHLLPVEAHAQLRAQLTDDAIAATVGSLHARLSSPLFGVTGEDARRDPLGLRAMAKGGATERDYGTPAGAQASSGGDLLARDGTAVLIQLHSERPVAALEADVRSAIEGMPVRPEIVGTSRAVADAQRLVAGSTVRLVALALAGITIVLATSLRAVRPALAILVCLGSGVAIAAAALPEIGPLALPMLVLLCGFGCEGSLHLQRISERGWPAAAVLGTALVPLWLSPYPAWKQWSVAWIVAVAIVMLVLRVVLPAVLAVAGGSASWERRGFLLRPMRVLAVIVTASVLGLGAWAAEVLPYVGANRLEVRDQATPEAQLRLREAFFDPALVVEARTLGRDAPEALAFAAEDARRLGELLPEDATRIDTPGSLVLLPSELKKRRASLASLDLRERMLKVREALESRGFRPDAFGEFLRSWYGGGRDGPTPSAALEGPLGPWIDRYLVADPSGGRAVRAFVHLTANAEASVPVVADHAGETMVLRGPEVDARRDGIRFRDWVGIYALCQLWLGALFVWLGTRRLGLAVSAAFAALVSQTAVLAIFVPLGKAIGPHIVPALLLVGAAAMIASGRACKAIAQGHPVFAAGLLVTSLCQVAAGLALVASGVPMWIDIGLVVAIGTVVASGAGLFLAPGLARLLGALDAPPRDDAPSATQTRAESEEDT